MMKCCFCGKECENEWGNNPWPIDTYDGGRSCEECTALFVSIARSKGFTNLKDVKI